MIFELNDKGKRILDKLDPIYKVCLVGNNIVIKTFRKGVMLIN